MLRLTITSCSDGSARAARLALRLARHCGGWRYTVSSPYLRKFVKAELVSDDYGTCSSVLRLLAGDTTGWHPKIAARLQRTMAMIRCEFIR